MLKAMIWLESSKDWVIKTYPDGHHTSHQDREGIFHNLYSAAIEIDDENQNQNFHEWSNDFPYVMPFFLNQNPAWRETLSGLNPPVLCVSNESTGKLLVIADDRKRNVNAIKQEIKGFLGNDGSNRDENGDGNGNGEDGGKEWGEEGGSGDGLPGRPCNFFDKLLEKTGVPTTIRKFVYFGGAAWLGLRAVDAPTKTGQYLQGAGAAALVYLALTESKKCQNK